MKLFIFAGTYTDKNTVKEAVKEHYACDGKEYTVGEHDDLEILKANGKEYLISSVAYKDALIKEEENNGTKIEIDEDSFEAYDYIEIKSLKDSKEQDEYSVRVIEEKKLKNFL